MKHPGTTECDLCHTTIPQGIKHAAIVVPLTKGDREELKQEILRDAPKIPMQNVFGFQFDAERMTPEVWQFEVCMGCIDGILRMLKTLKTEQIKHILRQRAEARARAEQQESEQEA
jgi:hypothetical protein